MLPHRRPPPGPPHPGRAEAPADAPAPPVRLAAAAAPGPAPPSRPAPARPVRPEMTRMVNKTAETTRQRCDGRPVIERRGWEKEEMLRSNLLRPARWGRLCVLRAGELRRAGLHRRAQAATQSLLIVLLNAAVSALTPNNHGLESKRARGWACARAGRS